MNDESRLTPDQIKVKAYFESLGLDPIVVDPSNPQDIDALAERIKGEVDELKGKEKKQ